MYREYIYSVFPKMQPIYIFFFQAIFASMKLTLFTDYALRVLMHLATHEGRTVSIGGIARTYGISQNHLVKVVHDLGKAGFIMTARGRGGGLKLARPADQIVVGDVIRRTEEGFDLVNCSECLIASACGLPRVLAEAIAAFLAVLDRHTLADLVVRGAELVRIFDLAASLPVIETDPLSLSLESDA